MSSASQVPEIKAQAIQEAARDPGTNVTSDDAQKTFADQSKQAGIPAYKFDPNASPAEKAAAARDVSQWLLGYK